MRFGINTYLFTSPFTNESTRFFPRFKQWGFQSVEIAIEDPAHIDPAYVRQELERHGLVCGSTCAVLGSDRDLRGTPEQQQNALTYLKQVLDQMTVLQSPILIGPLYSSVGRAEDVEREEYKKQWETVTGHLWSLSQYAQERGLKLGIEPLNRFETDFLNTTAHGLELLAAIDHPAALLLLDTFHMNIEEKDLPAAILRAGDKLGHFHACSNDRGMPGNDHINWKGIFEALQKIQYRGDIVIESFTKEVKAIARAAAIWRTIDLSQEAIALNGLQFLQKTLDCT